MRILQFSTITLAAALLGLGAAHAADPEGGAQAKAAPVDRAWVEQKVNTCAGCHGATGAEPIQDYPIIAGQYRSYLVHSLKGYRDGERENPIMSGQATGLTDAQIEALARYFSRQESPLHVPALTR